jgi:ribosomal protein L37E
VSTTLTRCRSCGRDTQTTEDWRCEHCGQPKPVTAEPVSASAPVGTPTRCGYCGRQTVTENGRCPSCGQPKQPPGTMLPRRAPSLWQDLKPQLAAAALSALVVVVALMMASELLLITAAAVLIAAVLAKIIADGW